MNCAEAQAAIPFVLDDEVEPHYLLEVEAHIQECPDCRAHLEREAALRDTLHRAMESVSAPDSLRRRLQASIESERRASHPVVRAWPALAAAAVLVVFVWQGATGTQSEADLEEVTQRHARNLPASVVSDDPKSLAQYFHDKVRFAVRLPDGVKPVRVSGRVTHLGNREAVHLRYDLTDGHFSLFAYESPKTTTVVENPEPPVTLRQVHGYNVARWQERGIVYSVVSEMPAAKLAPLIDVVAR
ncbi:MAG: zf-HC2 domain-containing protein [Myxococcota bacterium]